MPMAYLISCVPQNVDEPVISGVPVKARTQTAGALDTGLRRRDNLS